MASFEGKIVIITGGALGIGQATAWEFAKEGAMVAIADVNREAGEATVAEVERLGGSGLMLEADVMDSADCRRVVETTVERFGGVDILFNNVGIQPPASYTNVEDTSEEMWDRIIGVNLKSCFLMSKYSIPQMRERGGGVIINTASVQGLQSQPLVPHTPRARAAFSRSRARCRSTTPRTTFACWRSVPAASTRRCCARRRE